MVKSKQRRFIIPMVITSLPRFLLLPSIIALFAWVSWGYIVWKIPPDSVWQIGYFLAALFATISLTLSIPIFLIANRTRDRFTKERTVYRESLRRSAWIALFIAGTGVLKLTHALSWWNLFLFLITLIATEIYISSR